MLDLVVLLTLALVLMAALSLLFAGFVWMPWLIGLVLIGLLVALRRVTNLTDQQLALNVMPKVNQTAESSSVASPPVASSPVEQETPSHPDHPEPVMLYRGAKYKVGHSADPHTPPSHPPTTVEGKYRGNPWQRNQ